MAGLPAKANPPLVIDADPPLHFSAAFQGFQPVPGGTRKLSRLAAESIRMSFRRALVWIVLGSLRTS